MWLSTEAMDSCDLQIGSDDYVYEDGKKVESNRLPGYSGASGLDYDPDGENQQQGRGIMDSAGNGHDLEAVCTLHVYL